MTYQIFGSYLTVLVYPITPSPLECVFRRERGLIILSIFRESSNFDHTLIKNILADEETSQVKKFRLQFGNQVHTVNFGPMHAMSPF